MSEAVIRSSDGSTTTLTLNRPDKRNALSKELVEALLDHIATAQNDDTRLLVLRGEGKAFCAGFDFTGLDDHTDGDLVLRFIRIEQLLQAIWHAPFATLVLAHGACFGAGADLVCAAGHRVAAAGTKFRMPGMRFGIALGTGRLAETVGTDAARSLLGTSKVFSETEALDTGFISEIAETSAWNDIIASAAAEAAVLPVDAAFRLHHLTRTNNRDRDLAALVRSAAEPGLKNRIRAFIDT